MKRVWTKANMVADAAGYRIELDGKPVRLPGGGALTVTGKTLAQALAHEWDNLPADFTPADIPLTRLAGTAMLRTAAMREETITALATYGAHDVLCYRSVNDPALTQREDELWQPWLHWAKQDLGITLNTATGLEALIQPAENPALFQAHLSQLSDAALAGLGVIVPALGSLVLGLALLAGVLTPERAVEAACLEAIWQERIWAAAPAELSKRAEMTQDITDALRFIARSKE